MDRFSGSHTQACRLFLSSLGTRASCPRRGLEALAPLFPARQRNGARCENSQRMRPRTQRIEACVPAFTLTHKFRNQRTLFPTGFGEHPSVGLSLRAVLPGLTASLVKRRRKWLLTSLSRRGSRNRTEGFMEYSRRAAELTYRCGGQIHRSRGRGNGTGRRYVDAACLRDFSNGLPWKWPGNSGTARNTRKCSSPCAPIPASTMWVCLNPTKPFLAKRADRGGSNNED